MSKSGKYYSTDCEDVFVYATSKQDAISVLERYYYYEHAVSECSALRVSNTPSHIRNILLFVSWTPITMPCRKILDNKRITVYPEHR